MAVKVYGWAISPFVSRALLCLEEAGVDYELVAMSREAGDHRRPDFLARNVRAAATLRDHLCKAPAVWIITDCLPCSDCSRSGRYRCLRTETSPSLVRAPMNQ